MFVIGISGGTDRIDGNESGISVGQYHDSAATLLQDGQIVAAFEEERLNRIKHTNKFPKKAIQACLDAANLRIEQLDRFAVYCSEHILQRNMEIMAIGGPTFAQRMNLDPIADSSPKALMQCLLRRDLGGAPDADRIYFVKHHLAHAESAFVLSGFDRALVLTIDGQGDNESGLVGLGIENELQILRTTTVGESVGMFYYGAITFLGFSCFDEYKVMGLAPYGDPAVYRDLFRQLYMLKPAGEYQFHGDFLPTVLQALAPRPPAAPIEQRHRDFAAALQEATETIVLHVLKHYRQRTAMTNLCLAGGVAHNCTLNGKILESGLFSHVFVQPASHDAGCSLGAALHASRGGTQQLRRAAMSHVFLGTNIGSTSEVHAALNRWQPLISIRKSEHVAKDAAKLLAQGNVIGWVQGRAEFGPRALGNRSILADPRPAENKQIINMMIKKREQFRPFAPAVLAERAAEYFDIPATVADLSHMTYVLKVRKDSQGLLGAVTHVNGTARVQTVSRHLNETFWQVIDCFGALTGLPILLNTSFNNNAEPIVDSVDDAVVTFLTTQLHHLVVGDFLIQKHALQYDDVRKLAVSAPSHVMLRSTRRFVRGAASAALMQHELGNSYSERRVAVSTALFRVLSVADDRRTLQETVDALEIDGNVIFQELMELWSQRLVTLLPVVLD